MAWISTSRTREISQRAPREPWAVNLDHWSAQGLHSLFPLFGLNGLRDLVRGRMLARSGTDVTFVPSAYTESKVLDLSGGTTNEAFINSVLFPSEPFSYLCWANLDDTSAGFLMSTANSAEANQQHRMGIETINAVAARSFAGGQTTGGVTITAGVNYLFGGVFTSTTSRRSFTDGVGDTADTTSSGGPWTLDALSIGTTADSTPFGQLNGRVWDARIYSRALTATDMLRLRYDPAERWGAYYETGRRTYFVPAAAPASGVAPKAWHHLRNLHAA